MKTTSYRAKPCTQKNTTVLEHTPIYDLDAYLNQHKQQQKKRLINNFKDTAIFLSISVVTASLFFWGV